MNEINEKRRLNESDMLDRICWSNAMRAERFYPPRETAELCADGLESAGIEKDAFSKEVGYHTAALVFAEEFFDDMYAQGHDPVERTKRYIDNKESDLTEVDWEWLEESYVSSRHERCDL
jgi:hypothetical protein